MRAVCGCGEKQLLRTAAIGDGEALAESLGTGPCMDAGEHAEQMERQSETHARLWLVFSADDAHAG